MSARRPWTGRRIRALAWVAGAGCLVAAWFVASVTPTDADAAAPFVVTAAVGEPAVGRTLSVTVLDARLADAVTGPRGWSAEGSWLVVDLAAEAVDSEVSNLLGDARLVVGDREFRASERPDSMLRTPLAVGIPRAGSIAFELPADALTGLAVLRISGDEDTRLDSLIELELTLDELEHTDATTLRPTGWAAG